MLLSKSERHPLATQRPTGPPRPSKCWTIRPPLRQTLWYTLWYMVDSESLRASVYVCLQVTQKYVGAGDKSRTFRYNPHSY